MDTPLGNYDAARHSGLLAQKGAIDTYASDHRFTAKDVCSLHRAWLGPIYGWAGEYRAVNLGKGGFQLASARLIPGLMGDFERDTLAKYTPCREGSVAELATALAIVHAALDRDYSVLTALFAKTIDRTRTLAASRNR